MTFKKSLKSLFLLLLLTTSIIISCQNSEPKPVVPDVSGIDYELTINRYEQATFGMDAKNAIAGIEALKTEHPEFSEVFFHYILEYPRDENLSIVFTKEILENQILQKLYDTCMIALDDLSMVEEDLELAFKLYQHYFPGFEPPKIYTYISGFDYMVVPPQVNNTLGIGLDFFLGGDFPAYTNPDALNFPQYVARTFTKEHISAKVIDNMLIGLLAQYPIKDRQLLDFMIHEGKRLYILDKLLPYTPDSIKWGYTAAQTEWVKNNELAMWAEVFESKLFDKKEKEFQKLVSTSPNSPGMPPEAPGNTGSYVGYQMVKRYMANFPEMTFEDLLKQNDALKILKGSKYKPRR